MRIRSRPSTSSRDGARDKVRVRIEATQVTEELKKKLQKLGFVPDAGGDGKSLVGMVPINKLKEIAALSDVTAVKLEHSPAKT